MYIHNLWVCICPILNHIIEMLTYFFKAFASVKFPLEIYFIFDSTTGHIFISMYIIISLLNTKNAIWRAGFECLLFLRGLTIENDSLPQKGNLIFSFILFLNNNFCFQITIVPRHDIISEKT